MSWRWTIAAGMLLAVGAASATWAQGTTPQERGRERYLALCASCHGMEGAGDGPAASALRTPPPDLRRIRERHGGFDRRAVAASIDGRTRCAAHGSDDMPIWGTKRLRARRGDDGPTPRMAELLAYLESIQVQP